MSEPTNTDTTEPTIINAEYEEVLLEPSVMDGVVSAFDLDNRITHLEGQVQGLMEAHRNVLRHFHEMIGAVAQMYSDSSEE
tara:strand:- start:31 stop:273 length:243 start_codon:yes stop_codon:yes gene_type:complete